MHLSPGAVYFKKTPDRLILVVPDPWLTPLLKFEDIQMHFSFLLFPTHAY